MSFGVGHSPTGRGKGSLSRARRLGEPDFGIQSCGALLVVREPDLVIVQASENASAFLGSSCEVLGSALSDLGGNLCERIQSHRGKSLRGTPFAVRCRAGNPLRECDVLLHRPPSGGLAIELEPAGPMVDVETILHQALQPILSSDSMSRLCDNASRAFRDMTGYDRVLVFRFDEEGQGEVIAEQRKAGIASCFGQYFADAGIPPKAHVQIVRNRIRHLVDADEAPVPVRPIASPLTGCEIDLSFCTWRAMSPRHRQLLERMGVRGALVASLLVGGRLWGLVVCHHRTPRFLHYQIRAACALLAETVATRIAALEGALRVGLEARVRRLEARMVEAIAHHGDWAPALLDDPQTLLRPFDATGAILVREGELLRVGETPGQWHLERVLEWLDAQPRDGVIATSSLRTRAAGLADLDAVAAGLLATPLSSCGGEYLIWFRPAARADGWTSLDCGEFVLGMSHPARRGLGQGARARQRSTQWSPGDRLLAGLIGESVADVIAQFRSVRVLIAQAQLAQARSSFHVSDQPILIADAEGRIVLTTRAWEQLPGMGDRRIASLHDLTSLFSEPLLAGHRIRELMASHQPWREPIGLGRDGARIGQYLMRADPVFSAPGRVLGFVIMLTEIVGQGAAADSEARFHREGTPAFASHRMPGLLPRDCTNGELMAAVMENARRAAEDAADALGSGRAAALIEGVETSCSWTLELLERLLSYAGQASRDGGDRGI